MNKTTLSLIIAIALLGGLYALCFLPARAGEGYTGSEVQLAETTDTASIINTEATPTLDEAPALDADGKSITTTAEASTVEEGNNQDSYRRHSGFYFFPGWYFGRSLFYSNRRSSGLRGSGSSGTMAQSFRSGGISAGK